MDGRIPGRIVAVTEELASRAAAWCEAGRGRTLEEHETEVLGLVRAIAGRLLRAALGVAPLRDPDGVSGSAATKHMALRVGELSAAPLAGQFNRRRQSPCCVVAYRF